MDSTSIWALVGDTREQAAAAEPDSVVEEHVATLTEALDVLSDDEVRGFYRELQVVRAQANRWDLWAAAYLALGGASDDSFLDFRNWLISHGQGTYERVLADPDAVADLSWDADENDFGAATSTTSSARPAANRSPRTTTSGSPPGSPACGLSTAPADGAIPASG